MKKMITTLLLAITVMVPATGASAFPVPYAAGDTEVKQSPFQYADAIYGSFAELKQAVPTFKMEDYKAFNEKMAGALDVLGAAEFAKFQALVKEMTAIALPYYDENGQLDASRMTAEELAKFQAVVAELEPYFEKLG